MKQLLRIPKRGISSNWTFQKGKLSLQKLIDKATIDESIEQVNLVFPDQFGRLTGLKLNSEYFIEVMEASKANDKKAFFEFKYNPFRFDVLGKAIDFDEKFVLPKSLLLNPELSTLREMPWQKKEAIVMADVYHPDDETIIPYSPRHILKECAQKFPDVSTQIQFSFILHKFSKDNKEQHHDSNKGMLTLEQGGWSDILNDCRKCLSNIGIPLQSKDQTSVTNQFRFHLRKVEKDLLNQCDMYHMAKHAIKFIGFTHEYDISNLPIDSKDVVNDLVLNISGVDIHESQLQNVIFFAPNINSVRRIKIRKNGQIFKHKANGEYEIALAAPDVNLYLALSTLLKTKPNPDQKLVVPKTYSKCLDLFDQYKDDIDPQSYSYYDALFSHELKEFEADFTKWEVNRIY